MKSETLPYLRCPLCRESLEILLRKAVSPAGRLRDGLLQCRGCRRRFPVIAWVPRLLPQEDLTDSERESMTVWMRGSTDPGDRSTDSGRGQAAAGAPPEVVPEERLAEAELRRRMEERVRSKIVFQDAPEKLRARAEQDLAYRVYHTEEKAKFVRTALHYLTDAPRRILDVGGGQGGALTAFRKHFRPELSMLLDLDPEWVELAWLRDPETEVIRADATRMPLASGCMDFMFSSATLEHIPDWRGAVRELVRVSRDGLLCYNPNAGFPYDMGHLDAPLVTWLPRDAAAHVALAWHRLRRTGRTMESIRSELAVTQYIRRSTVVRELRLQGVAVQNALGEFLTQTVCDEYHLRAGGAMRLLREHDSLRKLLANLFLWTGTEPNVYLFYHRGESGTP